MRAKSWWRNYQGQVAISEPGVLRDGRIAVWVAGNRIFMTEAEWGALPIWWK
jgi:hypothetical protein